MSRLRALTARAAGKRQERTSGRLPTHCVRLPSKANANNSHSRVNRHRHCTATDCVAAARVGPAPGGPFGLPLTEGPITGDDRQLYSQVRGCET